ncbi:hypothetical protein BV898_08945 [Hypsibius exemplaris]|uniref:Receptor ligand binding region domain-containing protein n=1 Tax=Hypsibius exemplaris TaxID=2072580 RepID=A0A1W0WP36_HYPEX|nr:hypothetical protein BV898_08945 [Hypsibius exemplaris]
MCDVSCSDLSVLVVGLVGYSAETLFPAIELAAKEANQLYGPHVTFNYTVLGDRTSGGHCHQFQELVLSQLAEFYYQQRKNGTHLLLLPTGCSASIVHGGSDSALKDKSVYPTLVRLLPSKVEDYAKTFLAIMQRNRWRTATFICDSNSSVDYYFHAACQQFQAILKGEANLYTVYDSQNDLSVEYSRRLALTTARAQSRVILILAHMDLVRLTLVTAFRLGMTKDDYVFLTSLWYNFNNPELGAPHWFRNDSLDEVALAAFKSLLIVTMSSPEDSKRLREFHSSIDSISRKNNITVDYTAANAIPKPEGELYAIFAHAAFHAAAQMVNESIASGTDLNNGVDFARRMYNRTFSSLLEGHSFTVNANGDRDSLYAVLAVTTQDGHLEEVLLYEASQRIFYPSPSGRNWIRADALLVPKDRLDCTYYENTRNCHGDNNVTKIVGATLTVVVMVLLLRLIVLLITRYANSAWKSSPFNLHTKSLVFPPRTNIYHTMGSRDIAWRLP